MAGERRKGFETARVSSEDIPAETVNTKEAGILSYPFPAEHGGRNGNNLGTAIGSQAGFDLGHDLRNSLFTNFTIQAFLNSHGYKNVTICYL